MRIHKLPKPLASFVVMLLLTGLVILLKTPLQTMTNPPTPEVLGQYTRELTKGELEHGVVEEVTDGDTIKLDNGATVRLLSIDTPELAHPQHKIREECFGRDAKARMEQLALGKTVYLESDRRKKDKYARDLRYVYVEDELTTQLISLNEYMVGEGFARAYVLSPNIKYKDVFLRLQEEARRMDKGLWGACDVEKYRW
jgi:endonuclease YncB( thermonuclease family)